MSLLDDDRFDHDRRRASPTATRCCQLLDEVFKTRPAAYWLDRLDAADVPAGPVNELPEVFANPQIRHRRMLVETEHPLAGAIKLLANPMRLSATPVTDYPAPPLLGQHTREVLSELLGVDDATLDALAAQPASSEENDMDMSSPCSCRRRRSAFRSKAFRPRCTAARRELPFVEFEPGVEMQVLQVDIPSGLWVIRMRLQPGATLPTHRHGGEVFAFTLKGAWKYLEYPEVNTAGSYLYEPAGSIHTLHAPASNTEVTDVWFAIRGPNLNLDERRQRHR